MKCKCCGSESGFKFCNSLDSIGRIIIRKYCPKCGGYVGQIFSKSAADGCGYPMNFRDGSTDDFKAVEYERTIDFLEKKP